MDKSSITIGGIEFLSHTWPLVFGLPALLITMALIGAVYEVLNDD